MSTIDHVSEDNKKPSSGQVSALRAVTSFITGHDPSSGNSIIQSTRPGNWTAFDDNQTGFNVVYSTSFPASLTGGADIIAHDELMKSQTLGLVKGGGTVCRIVDFAPGFECIMHRTKSLDYGVVLEGSIEMILDSGERTPMGRGDVAVQRCTMHSWKNVSETEWARMLFVLQDCEKLTVAGNELKEDLGHGIVGLAPSKNDA